MAQEDLTDEITLRRYALGEIEEETERSAIEARLLTDDAFFERLEIVEDELCDDYLDDVLSRERAAHFETLVSRSPELRRKLELTQILRRDLKRTENPAAAARKKVSPQQIAKPAARWWQFHLSPFRAWTRLTAAAIVIVALGAGMAIWYAFFSASNAERGSAQLRAAYRTSRPIDARLTGFAHAPFLQTRSAAGMQAGDTVARDRAARILLDAAQDEPGAASFHALGRYYLSEREFEKAVAQFEAALKLDPENAEIHADYGAALLETGKQTAGVNDRGKRLETLAKSLAQLEKAVELDTRLAEPRFNRALCLEAMFLPAEAKAAWREYLEIDRDSPWAQEAQRNLQRLAEQKSEGETKQNVFDEFLTAYRNRDDETAWGLQSQYKEIFTGKLLHQQLAVSFLNARTRGEPTEADEFLQALIYLGELEKRRAKDSYFAAVAAFYESVSAQKYAMLIAAHRAVTTGFQLFLESKYELALKSFQEGAGLFKKAGAAADAKLAEYLVAFHHALLDRIKESNELLTRLTDDYRTAGYRFLLAEALYRLGLNLTAENKLSAALELAREGVKTGEAIQNAYTLQRNLLQAATCYRRLGRLDLALNYLARNLQLADSRGESERQKFRNYDIAARTFYAAGQYPAAAAYMREGLGLSEQLGDATFRYTATLQLGMIEKMKGKKQDAAVLLNQSRQIAARLADEKYRTTSLAYAALQLGHLERQTGECEKALPYYDQAVALADSIRYDIYKYESRKGKLLCYGARGDSARLAEELPEALVLFEENRTKIFEEQNRNSFFDREQEIYDLAASFEFERGNYREAYDYAETSRSRSLLDRVTFGAEARQTETEIETVFSAVANPLKLTEIRARIPAATQIVQYTVSKDKLLIWVIDQNNFFAEIFPIEKDELEAKVKSHYRAVTGDAEAAKGEEQNVSRELYRILIKPVLNRLDSAKEICFVPDKFLFHLSFAALQSPETEKYLIEDFHFVIAPSANVFILASENARAKNAAGDETLLSIGNPSFDRRTNAADLEDLPGAAVEAKKIVSYYGKAHLLTGETAVKQTVKGLMQTADVIHFAGHYVADETSPLLSNLILADDGERREGNLSSYELARERLPRTRLIILSACQTGVERFYNGEGMIGAARNLLAADVPLVVASQWKVDSDATGELMLKFHRYRKAEGLTTVAALRRAQIEMLQSRTERRWRQPYVWAAFVPFGGYATF